MSPLAKFVAIVALPCLLASAAECEDGRGSCAQSHKDVQDETMLVQVGTMLKKLVARASPEVDADFKPLPQNKTKIDEAMKRKSSQSGLPMTKHRVNQSAGHHDKHDDKRNGPSKEEPSEHKEEPSDKATPNKAIDNKKSDEQKEEDKMRKSIEKTGHGPHPENPDKKKIEDGDKKMNKEAKKLAKELKEQAKELGHALKKAMGGGGDDDADDDKDSTSGGGNATDSSQDRKNAMQAAIEEVDLQNLEEAEAEKNAAMATAAQAAASEDRAAMQLAYQAQKLADKNHVIQGSGADQKQLAEAISQEVHAEMDELSVRSSIEKQALQVAMEKVDAAELAAKRIAADAQKEAQARAR